MIVHIAGYDVVIDERYLRQRCAWCGAVLIDYDLALVAVKADPGEPPAGPGCWPVGSLVKVGPGISYTVSLEDNDRLPDDCCTNLDPAVTL